MADLKRSVTWNPGYSGLRGIGAMTVTFAVKGPLGGITFTIGTGWYPHKDEPGTPMGYGIDGHSPKPTYEGQTVTSEDCKFVEGGRCFMDGSSLQASELFDRFKAEGEACVWAALERRYESWLVERENRSDAKPDRTEKP